MSELADKTNQKAGEQVKTVVGVAINKFGEQKKPMKLVMEKAKQKAAIINESIKLPEKIHTKEMTR